MSDMGLERPVDDSVEQDQDVIPDAEELDEVDLRTRFRSRWTRQTPQNRNAS